MKEKRDTAIVTKFAPPYSILFIAELEEKILKKFIINQIYDGDIWMTSFSSRNVGKEMLRDFVENLNKIHPTIKFTAEWSEKSINFLDVTVSLIDGQIETYL